MDLSFTDEQISIQETFHAFAEREIRPAVLWRRTSFGCRSLSGQRFVAAMLTVTRSLRSQQRNVLDFLVESVRAHRLGQAGPSLLAI